MPKGYWIVNLDVTDPEEFDRYRAQVPAIIAAHGGRYLVRGGAQEVAEGTARARSVVVEFPSLAAARACYEGKAYQAVLPIRQAAASGSFLLVEGYAD